MNKITSVGITKLVNKLCSNALNVCIVMEIIVHNLKLLFSKMSLIDLRIDIAYNRPFGPTN